MSRNSITSRKRKAEQHVPLNDTDRDARPLTPGDVSRMTRTPQTKVIRRALELTQEEFAARYRIPLGTLRDWEQGRTKPDEAARAYLTVIARDPEHVSRLLSASLQR